MSYQGKDLQAIVARGKSQGYLTYDEVSGFLPDEDSSSSKLNALLGAVEERGIDLVDRPMTIKFEDTRPRVADDPASPEAEALLQADLPKPSDDPIRMYLSQMSGIPLLTREEEIYLAKKIEIARKRFRRSLLSCDFALRATVETLKKVYAGELPFDRTIKVSLTERLTKEQILARMPHNLSTIDRLMEQNRRDFSLLVSKSTPNVDRKLIRRRFIRNRRKCLQLVEELSLRTKRVQPLMRTLKTYLDRIEMIRARLQIIRRDPMARGEQLRLATRIAQIADANPGESLQSAETLRRYCQGFPALRIGQAGTLQRQPAAGGFDCQEVPKSRTQLPRLDPGGKHGPDASRRQV